MRWLAIVVLLGAFLPLPVRAAPAIPPVTAVSAEVMDGWTGHVLYSKNAQAQRDPASTVKIMTALVVLSRHIPMGRVITVSPDVASTVGSTASLYVGERLTLWDMLHAMLLPSGNDAAEALAEFVSITPARFVALMNAEAVRLHLRRTHYLTPTGLDVPGQLTTADDLAHLARIAMQMPTFVKIVERRTWTGHPIGGPPQTWTNLNHLLWWNRSVNGVKTGTTPLAGACLVSSARKAGRWVIAVNLGSTEAARFNDGMTLLDYGFRLASRLPGA